MCSSSYKVQPAEKEYTLNAVFRPVSTPSPALSKYSENASSLS
jgi:hypothetical protein